MAATLDETGENVRTAGGEAIGTVEGGAIGTNGRGMMNCLGPLAKQTRSRSKVLLEDTTTGTGQSGALPRESKASTNRAVATRSMTRDARSGRETMTETGSAEETGMGEGRVLDESLGIGEVILGSRVSCVIRVSTFRSLGVCMMTYLTFHFAAVLGTMQKTNGCAHASDS